MTNIPIFPALGFVAQGVLGFRNTAELTPWIRSVELSLAETPGLKAVVVYVQSAWDGVGHPNPKARMLASSANIRMLRLAMIPPVVILWFLIQIFGPLTCALGSQIINPARFRSSNFRTSA